MGKVTVSRLPCPCLSALGVTETSRMAWLSVNCWTHGLLGASGKAKRGLGWFLGCLCLSALWAAVSVADDMGTVGLPAHGPARGVAGKRKGEQEWSVGEGKPVPFRRHPLLPRFPKGLRLQSVRRHPAVVSVPFAAPGRFFAISSAYPSPTDSGGVFPWAATLPCPFPLTDLSPWENAAFRRGSVAMKDSVGGVWGVG